MLCTMLYVNCQARARGGVVLFIKESELGRVWSERVKTGVTSPRGYLLVEDRFIVGLRRLQQKWQMDRHGWQAGATPFVLPRLLGPAWPAWALGISSTLQSFVPIQGNMGPQPARTRRFETSSLPAESIVHWRAV